MVDALLNNTERPVVFALSNPSELCEADPSVVLHRSKGKALIATGSPFSAVEVEGALHEVPQGNNAFIFPGLGLGALAAGVETIPESLVLRAAQALATYTSHVGEGEALFPPTSELMAVAEVVALEVMTAAWEQQLTTRNLETAEDRERALNATSKRPHYTQIFQHSAERPFA